MIGYLLKRLLWFFITLWFVFTFSFFLMRSVPGGPFSNERALPKEVKANLEKRYHLNESLPQQYWRELNSYLHFDLGPSIKLADFSVNELIAKGLPISAALGILALAFALTLGISAGIISAVRRATWLDFGLMSIATFGIALPDFVIAASAVILFSFIWPIFPAAGWGDVPQLILPALCLGAPYAASIARLTRTGMLDVLSQDYIRTARAKGLPGWKVIVRHALPGAMLPVLTYLGPAIAGLLTGSLVIEFIFAVPGIGRHFVQAALLRDYPLAMGMIVLDTAIICGMNLVVDVCYQILDPRVKLE